MSREVLIKGIRADNQNKKKRPIAFRNGVMTKLHAYDNGALVGYGFMISYPNGVVTKPELFDIAGNRLASGYYQLNVTEENYPVVVPKKIQ